MTDPPALTDPLALTLHELGCMDEERLRIGGIPANDLAERFGTPLYAYDAGVLHHRLRQVQAAVGDDVQVLYSLKANPNAAIAAALQRAGAGVEVASSGELEVALAAGFPATEIRFAGPGKTDAEIEAALQRHVGCFHVESESECRAIAGAAISRGTTARIAVRVNPAVELSGTRMRMAGGSAKFGVDQDQVPQLLDLIAADESLRLCGLHVYAGTQCFDAEAWLAYARAVVTLAERWERELKVSLSELDLGGGFGVPTFTGDPVFDLQAAGAGIRTLVTEHARPDRRFLIELGRYLVAPAGVYLTRVVRIKESGGKRHAVLDGGLHHCGAAAGVGAVLRRQPLLVHGDLLEPDRVEPISVGGPLCTPADSLGEDLALPPLEEGDVLAILATGAYGLTFSSTGFLSHPTPPEVLVAEGRPHLARRRGNPRDVLDDQVLPGQDSGH